MSYDPRTLIAGGLRFVHPERRDGARRLIGVLEERLRGWMVGAGLAMLFVGTGAGVAVLLSFLFLGRLLGAVGLLLAVPALVFLTTVADELLPRDAPAEERSAAPADKSYDSIPS